jgi:Mn2+/Fe2+ NRAMP family transporter
VRSLLGLVVPVFHAKPVFVMIASQAFAAVVLPITVLSIFTLLNNKRLMGTHVNGWKDNIILSFILLFSFLMCGIGIRGLVQEIGNLW